MDSEAKPAAVSREDVEALFALPFAELLFRAQSVHRANFPAGAVQAARLVSIKTGGCPEDCGYCSQSAKFNTGVERTGLMTREAVRAEARRAKAEGASRFCMGAAWRSPKDRDLPALAGMIADARAEGLETCMTLGMLTRAQAEALAEAGLDYYNHNLDTSPENYGAIVSTRTFEDRLATLKEARAAGLKLCCGGIVGMGESAADRIGLLLVLANMAPPPESVPINALVPVPGTPLAGSEPLSPLEFARVIAAARILMPSSMLRLSAGREAMSEEAQALCFLAGANSIFVGERLLTAPNAGQTRDAALIERLGLRLA